MGILAFDFLVLIANIALLFVYLIMSRKFHWFDQPNESRKIHQQAIPTSAGIIFMAPMVLAYLLIPAWFPGHSYTIGSCILVLMLMGGVDDFSTISVKLRFLIVSVVCVFFLLNLYNQHEINYFLLFIYFLGMVWWLNLYNFMDGADGMAVLHAIVTVIGYIFAFAIFEINNEFALHYLIFFLMCLLSFLIFNFPRAKIFMGDSGSFSVSFTLATFALFGISQGIFDQILVISFHLVFIVDATLTLFTRLRFKHKISKAHNLHLFQSLIHNGSSHAMVSFGYAVLTLLTVVIGLVLASLPIDFTIRLTVLLLEAGILSVFWYKYNNKTKFKRFLS